MALSKWPRPHDSSPGAALYPLAPPAAARGESSRDRLAAWLPGLSLLAILGLAALVRLPHLATNPGWDGDEGYNYNIALNLAQGRHQMFALDFVFVQHPPLYFALAAGLFRLLGPSMLALRLLSVAFGLGTLALLPTLARALAGPANAGRRTASRIGLLAALVYAVWPFVALQNRFGYTYNGLEFWTTLTLCALLSYRRGRHTGTLILCGLACAAALATDQEALYLLPALLAGLHSAPLARRLGALALALAGPALYLGAMALTDPAALAFDLTHTAGRVTGGSAVVQVEQWLYSMADLARMDPLILIGLAGLALIPYRPARRLVLLLLASMLLVILKVRDPNPLFRTAEPLLPLICLGIGASGALLWRRLEVRRAKARPAQHAALLWAPLLAAVVACGGYDAQQALTRLRTPIDGLLPQSTGEASAMAQWLNRRLRPDDLVIAMPQVSWLLHARTTELLQAVAITGRASAFYPAGIAPRRWVYDAHLSAARYLVVDRFTRAWITQNVSERALARRAESTWRRVYAHGEYDVYENPARRS